MRLSSRAGWSFAASLACLAAIVNAAPGIMQATLVFPQNGEVYAPTPYVPIVFALQNASLANYTYPSVQVIAVNSSNPGEPGHTYTQNLNPRNWTSNEAYFAYSLVEVFASEGNWSLTFRLWWSSCGLNGYGEFNDGLVRDCTCGLQANFIHFGTKRGGRAIDVADATTNNKPCAGTAISVGDEVISYAPSEKPEWMDSNGCVMVNRSSAASTCPARINSALVANITTDITARLCEGANPPSSCPPKSVAHRPATVAGLACWAAAVAALSFLGVLA